MTVGRKPKPSALHELEGTRNRRANKNSEPLPTGVPTCPKHLDKVARAEWKRISVELITLGLLTNIDRAALAGYCSAWSRWIHAEEQVKRFGAVIKSPKSGYPIQNPYLGIAHTSLDFIRKWASEFGLTPASRTRLSVVGTGTTSGDPFEEFMRGIDGGDVTATDTNDDKLLNSRT